MTIGKNIKRLRQNKGLTQEQLGEILGITGQAVSIDRLKQLADINITAVIVIANLTNDEALEKGWGSQMLEQKYGAKVYSVITENDIMNVKEKHNL